jgi:hypothetical protein
MATTLPSCDDVAWLRSQWDRPFVLRRHPDRRRQAGDNAQVHPPARRLAQLIHVSTWLGPRPGSEHLLTSLRSAECAECSRNGQYRARLACLRRLKEYAWDGRGCRQGRSSSRRPLACGTSLPPCHGEPVVLDRRVILTRHEHERGLFIGGTRTAIPVSSMAASDLERPRVGHRGRLAREAPAEFPMRHADATAESVSVAACAPASRRPMSLATPPRWHQPQGAPAARPSAVATNVHRVLTCSGDCVHTRS